MAYEHKPGSASMFKNDRKEKDTHPDYKGDGMLPDGTLVWVDAWVKKPEGKKPFMSLSIKPKQQPGQASQPAQAPAAADFDDDGPF